MKIQHALIVFIVFTIHESFSQKIQYTYSPSGNRTIREYSANPFRVGNRDSTESAKEFRDIVMKEGISVFPNPTTGKLTLTLNHFDESEKNSVTLIDTKGGELLSQPVTQRTTEMDLSHLKIGVYYFRVIKNGQELYYKIVKVD